MNTTPKNMLVEVTNRCNHACIFCAHRKMKNREMEFGEIDPVLLKRILREAYEMGARQVGMYATGEMFLCKNLETHIRNAREIGYTYIYSDTNGALATKERMKSVLLAGLDSIKFSINAGSPESYRYIHGKDDFELVLKNLVDCYSLKEELGLQFKLMVSFVATSKTETEVQDFRERISPYVDEFRVSGARTYIVQDPEELHNLASLKYGTDECLDFCTALFNRIHITHDGFLTACCIDFNHDVLLADLKNCTLKEAWNCENVKQFRNRHLNRDLEGTLCYNCYTGKYHEYKPLEI